MTARPVPDGTVPPQVGSEIIERKFTALRRCGNRRFRLAAKATDRDLRFLCR